MVIQFTQHVLKQIKIRKIEKNEINDTLNIPDKIIQDRFGNFIAQKKYKSYLLTIVYLHKNDSKIIIAAYKSSKFSKHI